MYDLRDLNERQKIRKIVKTIKNDKFSMKFIRVNGIPFCVYDTLALKNTIFCHVPIVKNIRMHCIVRTDKNEKIIGVRRWYFTYRGIVKHMMNDVKTA